MAGSFVRCENERDVKTYHCTQLKFPPCAGYLTVTNKRLVFHGFSSGLGGSFLEGLFRSAGNDTGTNSRIVNEVKIDSVSGLNTFYGAKINTLKFILGCILLVIAIAFFATANGTNWMTGRRETSGFKIVMGFAFAAISIWQFLRSFRRSFFIKIYSSQTTGAIAIGEGVGSVIGSAAVFSMSALPTAETDQMMQELGAMVLDIQALGDRALEKWGSSAQGNSKPTRAKDESVDDDEKTSPKRDNAFLYGYKEDSENQEETDLE